MQVNPFRGMSFSTVLYGALLSACASVPESEHSYKLYPGPVQPAETLAIVQMGDAQVAEFNGRKVARGDWSAVHLLPGEHTIRWLTGFHVSPLVELSGRAVGGEEATLVLGAGQIYLLRAARTTGMGYRMYFWIEDASTGAVVAGTRKP